MSQIRETPQNRRIGINARHNHPGFKLQFELYLVPTKPLVPETIRLLILILAGHTVCYV
jgi:hypothetical protein